MDWKWGSGHIDMETYLSIIIHITLKTLKQIASLEETYGALRAAMLLALFVTTQHHSKALSAQNAVTYRDFC